MTEDDDDAFQRIVDGYGEVPSVAEVEAEVRRESTAPVERDGAGPEPLPNRPSSARAEPPPPDSNEFRQPTASNPTPWEDEGEFVPPPLPPAPPTTWQRLLAWAGLAIPPLVVLIATVTAWVIPGLLGYALIASAVGSFGYLVRSMPRGPRDPGDDGARV